MHLSLSGQIWFGGQVCSPMKQSPVPSPGQFCSLILVLSLMPVWELGLLSLLGADGRLGDLYQIGKPGMADATLDG